MEGSRHHGWELFEADEQTTAYRLLPVFSNQILLRQSQAHSFVYCPELVSCYQWQSLVVTETIWSSKLKIYCTCTFAEKEVPTPGLSHREHWQSGEHSPGDPLSALFWFWIGHPSTKQNGMSRRVLFSVHFSSQTRSSCLVGTIKGRGQNYVSTFPATWRISIVSASYKTSPLQGNAAGVALPVWPYHQFLTEIRVTFIQFRELSTINKQGIPYDNKGSTELLLHLKFSTCFCLEPTSLPSCNFPTLSSW